MRITPITLATCIALCLAATACTPQNDGGSDDNAEGDVDEGAAEGDIDGDDTTEGDVDGATDGDSEGDSDGDAIEELDVGECHIQIDCEGGQNLGQCTHTEMSALFPVCGIGPIDMPDECGNTEVRCEPGEVCDRVFGGCGGSYLACVPPCVSDADCAVDEQCSDSQCVALDCRYDDYECPSTMACSDTLEVPDPLGDDRLHGCGFLTCASDVDCASGDHCVTGLCSADIGVCELPRP